jgi:bacteriorhodopsin
MISQKTIINTFYITYVLLLTTGTITFIEAIRTKDEFIRNILNLETCISIVGAFFYDRFINTIEENIENKENEENIENKENVENEENEENEEKKQINYKKINNLRYIDWSITTPMMLVSLSLAFLYNTVRGSIPIHNIIIMFLLNYGMLGSGYLGEINILSRNTATIIGFGFFISLYAYIYNIFIKNRYNLVNIITYCLFIILWGLYGVFYLMDEVTKNIGYNILDLFSKCFTGIFFWAYFTKIISIK